MGVLDGVFRRELRLRCVWIFVSFMGRGLELRVGRSVVVFIRCLLGVC